MRTSDEKRYEIKGTYSPFSGHTAKIAYTKIAQEILNFQFQNVLDERSLFDYRQPQDLLSLHYSGVLTPNLAVEGQWASRTYTADGYGAQSTDLIEGTMLVDR